MIIFITLCSLFVSSSSSTVKDNNYLLMVEKNLLTETPSAHFSTKIPTYCSDDRNSQAESYICRHSLFKTQSKYFGNTISSSPYHSWPQFYVANKEVGLSMASRQSESVNGEGKPEVKEKLCSGLPGHKTVHAAHISEVHDVPMRVLIRPIPSILDEEKVASLMETIQNPGTEDSVPPIDILWVKGRQGGDYYYSFGGCHRYEAYKRLRRETIPCKVFKSTTNDIKTYLGGSMPDLL